MEKKTCLYDRHVALGALMSPFGGFIMPIQYTNITDEHHAVRNDCGVYAHFCLPFRPDFFYPTLSFHFAL